MPRLNPKYALVGQELETLQKTDYDTLEFLPHRRHRQNIFRSQLRAIIQAPQSLGLDPFSISWLIAKRANYCILKLDMELRHLLQEQKDFI